MAVRVTAVRGGRRVERVEAAPAGFRAFYEAHEAPARDNEDGDYTPDEDDEEVF